MKDGWHLLNKVRHHLEIKEGNIYSFLYLNVLAQYLYSSSTLTWSFIRHFMQSVHGLKLL